MQILPNEAEFLAPTDSRLRPDQRALEENRMEDGDRDKLRLEEKQRVRFKIQLHIVQQTACNMRQATCKMCGSKRRATDGSAPFALPIALCATDCAALCHRTRGSRSSAVRSQRAAVSACQCAAPMSTHSLAGDAESAGRKQSSAEIALVCADRRRGRVVCVDIHRRLLGSARG